MQPDSLLCNISLYRLSKYLLKIFVPSDWKPQKVKKLWEKAGIDPQSRDNKIFLPTEPEHHPTRSIHKGRHWDSVSEELVRKMQKALDQGKANNWNQEQYKEALTEVLKEERANLKSGERALNKNMREWADDKGKK